MRRLPMLLLLIALVAAAPEAALFDADGYRIAHYRGPVAAAPAGVTRIDTATARRLRAGGALFIDVLPAEGAVRGADGHWRLAVPRPSIPGAHWFPGAGAGAPDTATRAWLLDGVARLTAHDRRRRLVVFCLADCWLSWNAALRLARAGYARVFWYADGTDGWREAGLPLHEVTPEPG